MLRVAAVAKVGQEAVPETRYFPCFLKMPMSCAGDLNGAVKAIFSEAACPNTGLCRNRTKTVVPRNGFVRNADAVRQIL